MTCEFGVPGPLRDKLVAHVLAGEKTATASLRVEWEDDELPQVGERQLVVDSDGRGVATIEIVGVDTIRLADGDDRLAADEGEGFADAADWRAQHEAFWNEHVRPEIPDAFPLTDDTLVLVERFRLVD